MADRFRIRFTQTGAGVIANVSRTGERWMVAAQELPTMEAAHAAAQAMVREALALDAGHISRRTDAA